MIGDVNYFLGAGKFTPKDELVKKIVEEISSEYDDKLEGVRQYIHKLDIITRNLPMYSYERSSHYMDGRRRKETSSQVIESKVTRSCHRVGIVFCSLARELGIPTRYVETFQNDWLVDQSQRPIQGHIFIDVYYNGKWNIAEPFLGVLNGKYTLNIDGVEKEYTPYARGLDHSEAFVMQDNGIWLRNPIELPSSVEEIPQKYSHLPIDPNTL